MAVSSSLEYFWGGAKDYVVSGWNGVPNCQTTPYVKKDDLKLIDFIVYRQAH